MMSGCRERSDVAAIHGNGNVGHNRHSKRLLDDRIRKRVESRVNAGIAWSAWSGKTRYVRVVRVQRSREVREQDDS